MNFSCCFGESRRSPQPKKPVGETFCQGWFTTSNGGAKTDTRAKVRYTRTHREFYGKVMLFNAFTVGQSGG